MISPLGYLLINYERIPFLLLLTFTPSSVIKMLLVLILEDDIVLNHLSTSIFTHCLIVYFIVYTNK